MVNLELSVRRVTIEDGVNLVLTDVDAGVALAELVNAELVVVSIGQGYVDYDVYLTYTVGGALTDLEFAINSSIVSEGEDIDNESIVDIGTATNLKTHVHKRDSTNGRVITNILTALMK